MSSLSNAPAGYPDSKDGFPLIYAIGGDGKPVPGWEPRLYYDSQTFANSAEIKDYIIRVKARVEELTKVMKNQSETDPVLQPGAWDIRQGNNEDAAFEWANTFELCNNGLVGPMGAIHRLHSWIYDGTTETNPEFPNMTGEVLRLMCKSDFSANNYRGPLYDVLEKFRSK